MSGSHDKWLNDMLWILSGGVLFYSRGPGRVILRDETAIYVRLRIIFMMISDLYTIIY